jgi:hypothetical protein
MKKIVIMITVGLLGYTGGCQVGIGTVTPDPSSQLDITASSRGILVPRIWLDDVTTSQLDGVNNAAMGLLLFNTNEAVVGGQGIGFYFFDGTVWVRMAPQTALDDDWTDVGMDIERQSGNVYIGNTNATNSDLYISNRLIDWDDPNYFVDPAAHNKFNEIEFDDGSASDPSIRFDDATTGFFSPGADLLAYSINGSEKLRIDSGGKLGIGTAVPSSLLDVKGTFSLGENGNSHSGLYSISWDFGTVTIQGNSSEILTIAGTTSIWSIPEDSSVSVSFQNDLGSAISVQQLWMEADSVNFRLMNSSVTPVTISILSRLFFIWQ